MGAMNKGSRSPGGSKRQQAPATALDRAMRRGAKSARSKARSVMSDIWDLIKPDSMRSRRR